MLAAIAEIIKARHAESFSRGEILRCLHIEHGIRTREESCGDAEYVRQFCSSIHVPCRVITIPRGKIAAIARKRGIGIEASARIFRHSALKREARQQEAEGRTVRILIAHTRSDKLETTLMRMLRGSGPEGLASMPQIRGRIIRPLLRLERGDVLRYLRAKNILWREDASNQDERFERNRVRRSLVPVLNEKFSGWQTSLDALSHTQRLVAEFIREECLRRVSWQLNYEGVYYTDAAAFFSQPVIIREEALFQGIDLLLKGGTVHCAAVRRATVRRFCEGRQKTADFGLLRLVCGNGRIQLKKSKKHVYESGFSLLIKEPGLYTLKGVTVTVSPGFDSDVAAEGTFQVQLPVVLRQCLKDDWIWTGNSSGPKPPGDSLAGFPAGMKKFVPAKQFSAGFWKGLISVVDQHGTRAFIKPDELWLRAQRQSGAAQDNARNCWTVTIKGSNAAGQ